MTDRTRPREFAPGSGQYCTGVGYAAEVVSRSVAEIARVRDGARHVEGATDLRGEAATLGAPTHLLGLDGRESSEAGSPGARTPSVVFGEQQCDTDEARDRVADGVQRGSRVDSTDVDTTGDDQAVEQGVNRGAELLVWASPEVGAG